MDSICQKKASEPCSQILADHDIDQIDIDKLLIDESNKYDIQSFFLFTMIARNPTATVEPEIKKNLLSNFDAGIWLQSEITFPNHKLPAIRI